MTAFLVKKTTVHCDDHDFKTFNSISSSSLANMLDEAKERVKYAYINTHSLFSHLEVHQFLACDGYHLNVHAIQKQSQKLFSVTTSHTPRSDTADLTVNLEENKKVSHTPASPASSAPTIDISKISRDASSTDSGISVVSIFNERSEHNAIYLEDVNQFHMRRLLGKKGRAKRALESCFSCRIWPLKKSTLKVTAAQRQELVNEIKHMMSDSDNKPRITLCTYFKRGSCRKGDEHKFLHNRSSNDDNLSESPNKDSKTDSITYNGQRYNIIHESGNQGSNDEIPCYMTVVPLTGQLINPYCFIKKNRSGNNSNRNYYIQYFNKNFFFDDLYVKNVSEYHTSNQFCDLSLIEHSCFLIIKLSLSFENHKNSFTINKKSIINLENYFQTRSIFFLGNIGILTFYIAKVFDKKINDEMITLINSFLNSFDNSLIVSVCECINKNYNFDLNKNNLYYIYFFRITKGIKQKELTNKHYIEQCHNTNYFINYIVIFYYSYLHQDIDLHEFKFAIKMSQDQYDWSDKLKMFNISLGHTGRKFSTYTNNLAFNHFVYDIIIDHFHLNLYSHSFINVSNSGLLIDESTLFYCNDKCPSIFNSIAVNDSPESKFGFQVLNEKLTYLQNILSCIMLRRNKYLDFKIETINGILSNIKTVNPTCQKLADTDGHVRQHGCMYGRFVFVDDRMLQPIWSIEDKIKNNIDYINNMYIYNVDNVSYKQTFKRAEYYRNSKNIIFDIQALSDEMTKFLCNYSSTSLSNIRGKKS